MIPKSLDKLSQAASAWAARSVDQPPAGDGAGLDWLPPLLGAAPRHAATTSVKSDADTASDTESDVSSRSDATSDAPLTPSAARDLHTLVAQLKSLTARLGALEAKDVVQGGAGGWCDALLGLARREGVAVGGVTVAAVAAVVLWRRGRRR